MRVFVTGATGFVGSAIVKDLIQNGYQVVGLARNQAAAQLLSAAGAEVHQGDLANLESLRTGAAQADAVIHTAFVHDFNRFQEVCEIDQRAIEALGSALVGSDRPLLVSAGMAVQKAHDLATEEDRPALHFPRKTEEAAAQLAERGVHVSVVRLPPSVHGEGDHAFVPNLIATARAKGVSAYVGEGLNRWAAVHRLDAANLYRLALEKGRGIATYHAVADEGIPFLDIATHIGRRLNVPVVAMTPDEANAHFGWFAVFAALDLAASSHITRERLGWRPEHLGLMADIDLPHYFNN